MNKTVLAALAAVTTITAVPVAADPPSWAPAHGRRHHEAQRYQNYQQQRDYNHTDKGVAYWQGDNGQYYCRRSNGTTGLLVGGALGALLGREVDRRGDRATGTILGAAAGALLGREVERGRTRCR